MKPEGLYGYIKMIPYYLYLHLWSIIIPNFKTNVKKATKCWNLTFCHHVLLYCDVANVSMRWLIHLLVTVLCRMKQLQMWIYVYKCIFSLVFKLSRMDWWLSPHILLYQNCASNSIMAPYTGSAFTSQVIIIQGKKYYFTKRCWADFVRYEVLLSNSF
jgi:hypothetical protein